MVAMKPFTEAPPSPNPVRSPGPAILKLTERVIERLPGIDFDSVHGAHFAGFVHRVAQVIESLAPAKS